jgi:DHA2 family multidrug resistance protein
VTTVLARRAQYHQNYLAEHLTPLDRNYQFAANQTARVLQYNGLTPSVTDQGSLGVIYSNLIRQATMISFNDAFYLLSILMIAVVPLVLLMRRTKEGASPAGLH